VKWLKLLIGILLLPVCYGAGLALRLALQTSGGADTTWVPLLAGGICWLVIYLLLPKPMLIYVFGHELTHALWTWLFLGSVKKFKASAKGGKVVITRENFLITLAPYFFPLYAVFVVLVFWAGDLIWGWTQYRMWFHLMLGAAYSFHITLTWHVLKTEQSDITSQGYLFSAVIIFIGNVMLLLIAIPLLANQNIPEVFRWWYAGTVDAVTWLKTMALSLRP
jgi:hypothetical protein